MIVSFKSIPQRSLLVIILISVIAFGSVKAQVTEVAYMKVKESEDEYLKVEKEWKKVHKKLLDSEKIYAWYLIRKHYHGTEDPYDYITVTVYPNMGSILSQYPDNLFDGLDQAIIDKTDLSRDLVKTELYDTPLILEVTDLPQFLNMDFMKVEQGNDDAYLNAENDLWKPINAELKKTGILSSWSVYRQLYPGAYGGEYNYVTVNGFADLKKVTFEPDQGWEAIFKKVHPGMNFEDAMARTLDSRRMVKAELWEIIDKVTPQ